MRNGKKSHSGGSIMIKLADVEETGKNSRGFGYRSNNSSLFCENTKGCVGHGHMKFIKGNLII